MARRQTTVIERRTTRSSGNLEPPRELPTRKKRKIEVEDEPQEIPIIDRDHDPSIEHPKEYIRLPARLSDLLIPHFRVQKQAVLRALKDSNLKEFHSSSASEQLKELIHGTVSRQEGNSCLILGPRGSGKTKLVEDSLSSFKSMAQPPIIIRLSGDSQINDRLAMREILRQIQEQSGIEVPVGTEEDENHRHPQYEETSEGGQEVELFLPPVSHLPQLIGSLPNLGWPVIIVLDSFEKFTEHARQALLYCLLDTVQSCRGELADNDMDENGTDSSVMGAKKKAGTMGGSRKECGLLVIGITCRIDCVTLLEKRELLGFFREILTTDPGIDHIFSEEWQKYWSKCISDFISGEEVQATFKEIYSFSKDIRTFVRVLLTSVASLTADSPWLRTDVVKQSVGVQRCRNQFPFLRDLAYPHVSLLIAAIHASRTGQETVTFELLYDVYMKEMNMGAVKFESERGEIKVPYMTRNVLLGAFESLVYNCVFHPAIGYATHISREFMKYECKVSGEEVKDIVDERGHAGIRRWFYKSQ